MKTKTTSTTAGAPTDDELIKLATAVRANAHAPYSGFRVGSVALLKDGSTATGVNVENASFGLTVCSERNAVAAAVCGGAQPGDLIAVTLVADAPLPTTPCGACRQVMMEIGTVDTRIIMRNLRDGSTEESRLGDLIPSAFASANLPTP